MQKLKTAILVLAGGLGFALIYLLAKTTGRYSLASFLAVGILLALCFAGTDRSRNSAKEIVLIAVLAAVASVGRVIFASLPFFKPVSAVVIIAGCALGKRSGFLVGATVTIVSNMFFGQGPWTFWQILCWGGMGFLSGLLAPLISKRPAILIPYGFIVSYLFGVVMNVYHTVTFLTPTWGAFLAACAASFIPDLIHGASTVLFLLLAGISWIAKIERVKGKMEAVDS